ncbi:MAG: DNA-binding transcriptional LysR family regulator [Halieaceae bacterium]
MEKLLTPTTSPADWSDIAVFLAVLDAGNLVAAAAILGLSQPTVGRRLAALEARMGVTLFARTGRQMVPTEVAASIEESARKMAREMYAIRRGVAGAARGLWGQVTISANEGTGSEWLVPVLADLHLKHPEIFVDLLIESRAADLVKREADIALRMGRPTQLDLIARRLASVGFGLYASLSWLERNGPVEKSADLEGKSWVRGIFMPQSNELLEAFFNEHDLECKIAMATNSPAAQIKAVESGIGVGVLSHRWASRFPGLRRLLPEYEAASIDLWLVTHEDLRHSARIRAVADHIVEAAEVDKGLFARGELPDANAIGSGPP